VKYLLVGLGNIGRKRQTLLGDRCIATVDPYNSAAQFSAVEECSVATYDAAIVATPNQLKLELLHYFLERGKHVLVEKPLLFTNAEDARRLDAVAQTNKALWYTSYNHRFETLIARARELLLADRIGAVYHARLLYGNGTVGNVVNTWRDQGMGVLEDLGSHLLDLSALLLDQRSHSFRAWSLQHHELSSFDHCVLASTDGRIELEMSYLSWKNTFTIDVFGARGSLHLNGLQKWGASELVVRERVFPSGVPIETREAAPGGVDPTWQRDLDHFEALCAGSNPGTSVDNDLWISQTLYQVSGA
jgi:predicted dehydrogenase